jgi:hypothetical protein
VHDPALVGARDREGDLAHERDRLLRRKRAAVEAPAQRPSLEERHREPRLPRVRAAVEDRDVPLREPEAREESALALEGRDLARVRREEELDRDLAPVVRARAVDGARASAADLSRELVGADAHAAD